MKDLSNGPRRGGIADAARAVLGNSIGAHGTKAPSNAAPTASKTPVPLRMAEPTAPKPSRANSGHPSVDTDVLVDLSQVRTGNVITVSDLLGGGRDEVFELLERRAKVMLSAGRFVRISDEQVEFGLPNAMHLQRCVEWLPTLTTATSAALGRPITVLLVVDSAASPGPLAYESEGVPVPTSGRRLVAVPPLDEDAGFEPEDEIDLSALADANDVVAPSTLDHLTSVFPGAEIVDDTRR